LDRVDPKAKETSESFLCGKETYVGLHEANKARKIEDGVAREMMGLKLVEIKELPEEIRGREAKTTLEVSRENYIFSGFRRGLYLIARKPANYFRRNPPGAV
jgi:hypothetical protein